MNFVSTLSFRFHPTADVAHARHSLITYHYRGETIRRGQFSSRARSPTCIFGATIRLFGHRVVQHRDVVQHSVSRVAHCKQRLALHSKQSSSTCYLAFSFPCYVLCIRLFIFNLSSVLLLPLPAILSNLLVRRSPTTVRKDTPWPFVGPG